ncbi:sodium-dependent acetylcholine transporter-like [Condylostylus longicornis]|uniref:sodium-dependent acetylcholine transporter-like n=1 Tax=Condylostylus longicornis TaxID=2530218 RepID=UPI00244DB0A2|nr:sodium-dependent acetylcholine transporter-like [Condylostylus longicornis]
MSNINTRSYETGNKPFKHDRGRGKWSTTWDFYAIILSNSLGFRHFILNYFVMNSNPIIFFALYSLGMITFVLPTYFTQMFLGQFSNSGLISAFRIVPLFKVIGYASFTLNILTCSYCMITAALPLFVIFDSLRSELPWTHCNNSYNTENCIKTQSAYVFENGSNYPKHWNSTLSLDEYFRHETSFVY